MDWFGTLKQKSVPHHFYSVFRSVAVSNDTVLKLKYSILPARFITLPFDRGVPIISRMTDQESNFKYLPQGGSGLFSRGRAENLEGHVGFWNETGPNNEDRVYYKNLPHNIEEVLVKLPGMATSIDGDDPLPLMEGWAWTMVQEVYKLYSRADNIPDDDKSDANDSKQQ